MLKYIKIRNFLSFYEETEISFESSKKWNKKDNCFKINNTVLDKSMLIYWANASWKSNILKAINFVRDFALNRWNNYLYKPFKFNEKKEPSFLEIWFFVDKKEYIYNFEILDNFVNSENLIEVSKWEKNILFSRDKEWIKKVWKSFKEEMNKWIEKIRPEVSALSVLSQWNWKLNNKSIDYFFSRINVIWWNQNFLKLTLDLIEWINIWEWFEKDMYKKIILQILRNSDILIDDFKIIPLEFSIYEVEEVWLKIPKEILDFMKSNGNTSFKDRQIIFYRKDKKWKEIPFSFETEESLWTRKLFSLIWPILHTILTEWVLFIDEIENNLHEFIVENIFKLLHSDLGKKYQVIMTSHNINFMDLENFRKTQIWIVEKNGFASEFYTLFDFPDIRSENKVKNYYRNWAFWWTPNISDFTSIIDIIKWESKN